VDKIGFALRVLCLPYQRADGRSAAKHLPGQNKVLFSRSRYFANLTTRNAKANDLSLTGFPSFSFLLTSQLVIRRFLAYRKSCKQPHYLIRGTGPPPDNPAIIHSQFSIINYSLYPLALRPSSALLH
jgi:hypothetical protein